MSRRTIRRDLWTGFWLAVYLTFTVSYLHSLQHDHDGQVQLEGGRE